MKTRRPASLLALSAALLSALAVVGHAQQEGSTLDGTLVPTGQLPAATPGAAMKAQAEVRRDVLPLPVPPFRGKIAVALKDSKAD